MKDNLIKVKKTTLAFKIFVALFVFIVLGLTLRFGYNKFVNIKKAEFFAALQNKQRELPVMQVYTTNFSSSITLPARISAYEIAEIRPQVNGILREIKFEQGGYVKKNQKLYEIDKTIYLAQYKKAESNLKTAKINEERYRNLLTKNAVSTMEYNNYLNALEAAKGDFELAKENLIYTDVLAPISGFITQSNFTKGALLSAGQAKEMATISNLSPIYANIIMPRKNLTRLGKAKNLRVDVMFDGGTETGVLEFSEVIVDKATDSVALRAVLQNKETKLLPGMYVSAKIILRPEEVVIIPQRATMRNQEGKLYVFTLDKNDALEKKIITEKEEFEDKWIISSGLEHGDVIILEGFQKVEAGTKIKPVYSKTEVVKSN